MSLAERRIVQEFETVQFPALYERIKEAAGFAVPMEVDWNSLAIPGESRLYLECWPQVFFEPLIAALKEVGRDQMGRDGIKDGLKKIVVRNTKGCTYGSCWASFEAGTLTLDHEATTNAVLMDDRRTALIELLENSL